MTSSPLETAERLLNASWCVRSCAARSSTPFAPTWAFVRYNGHLRLHEEDSTQRPLGVACLRWTNGDGRLTPQVIAQPMPRPFLLDSD